MATLYVIKDFLSNLIYLEKSSENRSFQSQEF